MPDACLRPIPGGRLSMPQYRYKALNAHGELFDGQMEAASEAEVAARLQD